MNPEAQGLVGQGRKGGVCEMESFIFLLSPPVSFEMYHQARKPLHLNGPQVSDRTNSAQTITVASFRPRIRVDPLEAKPFGTLRFVIGLILRSAQSIVSGLCLAMLVAVLVSINLYL